MRPLLFGLAVVLVLAPAASADESQRELARQREATALQIEASSP